MNHSYVFQNEQHVIASALAYKSTELLMITGHHIIFPTCNTGLDFKGFQVPDFFRVLTL